MTSLLPPKPSSRARKYPNSLLPPEKAGGHKKKSSHRGFWGSVGHALGKTVHNPIGNEAALLARQSEGALLGLGPAIAHTGKATVQDVTGSLEDAALALQGKRRRPPKKSWAGKNVPQPTTGHLYHEVLLPIGKSYGYKYGPLFHGHPLATAQRAWADPLGTLGDIGLVTTGSVSGATKLGLLKEAGRTVELRSAAARLADEMGLPREAADVIRKPIVGSELGRRIKIRTSKTLNKLDYQTAGIGERARYGRAFRRQVDVQQLRRTLQGTPHMKQIAKLKKGEREALDLLNRLPIKSYRDEYRKMLAENSDASVAFQKILNDPKVEANIAKMEAGTGHVAQRTLDAQQAEDALTALREEIIQQPLVGRPGTIWTHTTKTTPRTLGEAEARLQELETQYDTLVSSVVDRIATPEQRKLIQLDLNRAQKGWKTRGGKQRGAYKPPRSQKVIDLGEEQFSPTADKPPPRSVVVELRRQADARLRDVAEKNNSHEAQQLAALIRERDSLHSALTDPEHVFGGAEIPPEALGETTTTASIPHKGTIFVPSITPATIAASPYRHLRIVSGAERVDKIPVPVSAADELKVGDPVRVVGKATEGRVAKIDGESVTVFYPRFSSAKTVSANELELMTPGGWIGGKSIPQLQDEIAQAKAFDPRYTPDTMQVQQAGTLIGKMVSSVMPKSLVQPSKGLLFQAGHLVLDANNLSRQFLKTIRWEAGAMVFQRLKAGAVVAPDHLPQGWQYLRKDFGEKIGYMEKNRGEFERLLEEHVSDSQFEPLGGLGKYMTTKHLDEAWLDEAGNRLMVPSSLVRQVAGEWSASNQVIRAFFHGTAIWRALVLNLRVGWLTNNVVGNTLLYALGTAGQRGRGAYLRAYADLNGAQSVAKLLRSTPGMKNLMRENKRWLTGEEISPDLMQSFIGVNMPGPVGPVTRALSSHYSPTQWLRTADRTYEQLLRRAAGNRFLESHPEVRRFYESMPELERNWRAAKLGALERNPEIATSVAQSVNGILGDFLGMGRFEQNVLRATMPFYGWYRAITMIMLRFPLEHPLTAVLAAKMGVVNQQLVDDWWRKNGIDPGKLPVYMRNVILLPGGKILRVSGPSPWTTTVQLLDGVFGAGQAQEITGTINPIIWQLAKGGAAAESSKSSFVGEELKNIGDFFRFLPETSLAFPYASKKYLDQGYGPAALSYLGVPIRTPNLAYLRQRYPLHGG